MCPDHFPQYRALSSVWLAGWVGGWVFACIHEKTKQGVQTLIHDTNKKVRTAFVKLLLVVKGVKSIKYYQVVNVDHILARLSEDHLK